MTIRCYVAILGSLIGAGAWGQLDPIKDFAATAKDAYLMLPPELICGPTIDQMEWSQDGERLVVSRTFRRMTSEQVSSALIGKDAASPEDLECQIFTWNAKTDKTTMLFKLKGSDGDVQKVSWMAGSSSLIVEANIVTQPSVQEYSVFLVSASGQVKKVATLPSDVYSYTYTSPYKPIAEYVILPTPKKGPDGTVLNPGLPVVRFFGTDGVLSAPLTMPSRRSQLEWSSNGQAYVINYTTAKDSKTLKKEWFVINRTSMTLSPTEPPPDLLKPSSTVLPLVVNDLSGKMAINKVGVSAPTVTLNPTVEGGEASFGIVTTDGRKGDLAPNLSAVVFQSQGNAMVRPLAKVPLEAFRQAKLAALRRKLLSQAKQAGLALIMNSGDNDDNLPSNKGNWQAGLMAYTTDPNLFDGFNYTFGGGSATAIEEPASTILGYIEGPGGRAVVYTDGHAKWIPNP